MDHIGIRICLTSTGFRRDSCPLQMIGFIAIGMDAVFPLIFNASLSATPAPLRHPMMMYTLPQILQTGGRTHACDLYV